MNQPVPKKGDGLVTAELTKARTYYLIPKNGPVGLKLVDDWSGLADKLTIGEINL